MFMIATSESIDYYSNLINAGAPEWLAKFFSSTAAITLNFWVWLSCIVLLIAVGFIDWKYPHLFPKRLRRIYFSEDQKKHLPLISNKMSRIIYRLSFKKGVDWKEQELKELMSDISDLRSVTTILPSNRLSFAIIDFCKYADKILQSSVIFSSELEIVEKIRDKILRMIAKYTD